jgi:hypothetical protein
LCVKRILATLFFFKNLGGQVIIKFIIQSSCQRS